MSNWEDECIRENHIDSISAVFLSGLPEPPGAALIGWSRSRENRINFILKVQFFYFILRTVKLQAVRYQYWCQDKDTSRLSPLKPGLRIRSIFLQDSAFK